MIGHVPKGIAERLGYALGLLVRFCVHHRNPKFRWAKRGSIVAIVFVLLVVDFRFFFNAFMDVVCIILVAYALTKLDYAVLVRIAPYDDDYAPHGKDIYGRSLEPDQKPDSGMFDSDPFSPRNINSSLFHESDFKWK